jgi:hypothetical protein
MLLLLSFGFVFRLLMDLLVDVLMHLMILSTLPRSNQHDRKRSYMKKYDDIHGPVLRPFISVSYTDSVTVDLGIGGYIDIFIYSFNIFK